MEITSAISLLIGVVLLITALQYILKKDNIFTRRFLKKGTIIHKEKYMKLEALNNLTFAAIFITLGVLFYNKIFDFWALGVIIFISLGQSGYYGYTLKRVMNEKK